mmetsp:Transcript_92409/g.183471  ORF Transcript_92409/g.183471 Transcript_92409/m.183471 type:complete len:94 (-) Transcript_92409:11-292(-)
MILTTAGYHMPTVGSMGILMPNPNNHLQVELLDRELNVLRGMFCLSLPQKSKRQRAHVGEHVTNLTCSRSKMGIVDDLILPFMNKRIGLATGK